ncbi:hypothetical protein WA556_000678 [Blastocystis sp. ATCC 50177/Nand II]
MDGLLAMLLGPEEKGSEKEKANGTGEAAPSEGGDSEYEYEDYSDESTELQVFVDPEGVPDTFQDGQAKVEEQVDGMVSIPNEDNISAFDIDINRLKIKKWEMTGEESDYFNYGLTESMWKDYASIIRQRRGHVRVDELKRLSDTLTIQASYMPYSSSASHASTISRRPSHSSSFGSNVLPASIQSQC